MNRDINTELAPPGDSTLRFIPDELFKFYFSDATHLTRMEFNEHAEHICALMESRIQSMHWQDISNRPARINNR
jgi:hypothetical protein